MGYMMKHIASFIFSFNSCFYLLHLLSLVVQEDQVISSEALSREEVMKRSFKNFIVSLSLDSLMALTEHFYLKNLLISEW